MGVFLRTKLECVFQRKALYLMFWVILLRRTQVDVIKCITQKLHTIYTYYQVPYYSARRL
jgi:hypothetical protein